METETIAIGENEMCKIDCGTHGFNIDGPAVVVVIKETSTKAEISERKLVQNHRC